MTFHPPGKRLKNSYALMRRDPIATLQSKEYSVIAEQQLWPCRRLSISHACLTHATFCNKIIKIHTRTTTPPLPPNRNPTLYCEQSHTPRCTFYTFWTLVACKTWVASSLVISPYQEIQMKLHSYRRLLEVYRSPICFYKRCIFLASFLFFPYK